MPDDRALAPTRRRGPLLSARLEAIAARVLVGYPVVDVGTDHGWLPIALLARHHVPSAIAIDVREAPLAVAARNAARLLDDELRPSLTLTLGDGLMPLGDHVGTIVIAGMGGARIVELLTKASGQAKWPFARRFVLAPNEAVANVRAALLPSDQGETPSLGITLVDEVMVRDHGRYFPVLIAEPIDDESLAPAPRTLPRDAEDHALDVYAGPYLRARRDPVWLEWLRWRRVHLRRAANRVGAPAARPDAERAAAHPLSTSAARELAWVEALLAECDEERRAGAERTAFLRSVESPEDIEPGG